MENRNLNLLIVCNKGETFNEIFKVFSYSFKLDTSY